MTTETHKTSNTHYFSFDPSEWIDVLALDNEIAGKIFKEAIIQLSTNKVPEESRVYPMYKRTEDYRQKQRERINKRWHKDDESPQPVVPPPPPQMLRPTRPIIPPRKNEVDIRDVYDFCDANGIVPTIGKEWHDYMSYKNWPKLKTDWRKALTGFAKKKQ